MLGGFACGRGVPSASSDAVRLIRFYLVGEQEPQAPNHGKDCHGLKRDDGHKKTGNTQRFISSPSVSTNDVSK
jgi:hypothetical protein